MVDRRTSNYEPAPHATNVAPATSATRHARRRLGHEKKVVRARTCRTATRPCPSYRSGYRLGYDSCGCLTSIFEVHNETINIWTHWLGALWFAYLIRFGQLDGNLGRIYHSDFPVDLPEPLRVVGGLHTFGAISPRAMRLWLRADKLGISLMIAGSYIPGIWLGFRCRPRARLVWMAQALILLIVGAMLALECFPKRHSAKAFASLVAIGLLPTADFAMHGTAEEIRQFVPKLMLMFFFYGLGFFFFSTKWPESRWPGRFCIVGASHRQAPLCARGRARVARRRAGVPRARRARQPRRPLW